MTQATLFETEAKPKIGKFGGSTYDPVQDEKRLTTLYQRVFALMKDGKFRTLREIQERCGGSEASVSARLRDCRKEGFGSHTVNRKRVDGGLYQYQLIVRGEA